MTFRTKFDRAVILKVIIALLVIVFLILFFFKDQIADHKVTKAKMEMLHRMYKSPPEEWDEEFKQVYDSLILEKVDSSEIK